MERKKRGVVGVPLPFLLFFLALSSKKSLNRSSTTTLFLSFLIRLKRGSVFRRAKRGSDMVGGGERLVGDDERGSQTTAFCSLTEGRVKKRSG